MAMIILSASQMTPYSLYSALLLTRSTFWSKVLHYRIWCHLGHIHWVKVCIDTSLLQHLVITPPITCMTSRQNGMFWWHAWDGMERWKRWRKPCTPTFYHPQFLLAYSKRFPRIWGTGREVKDRVPPFPDCIVLKNACMRVIYTANERQLILFLFSSCVCPCVCLWMDCATQYQRALNKA